MEHRHIMIGLSMKGGLTPIHENTIYSCLFNKDQRPASPESDHFPWMEVHYEDPVNPRGSRACSFAVYFGMG